MSKDGWVGVVVGVGGGGGGGGGNKPRSFCCRVQAPLH